MDVRCERCKARYAIPDDRVTAEGLTLRCTACGHAFKVRKKELVVTVAVTGEEAAGAIPAHELVAGAAVAAPAPRAAPAAESLILRSLDGGVRPVADLATLQRWIAERRAGRDDELSRGGGPYLRLGLLPDLAPILALVEAADRAARQPAPLDVDPFGQGRPDEPPVRAREGAPPRPDPRAASPLDPGASAPLPVHVAGPAEEAEPLDEGELAALGPRRGRQALLAAAVLALLGAGAWLLWPGGQAGPLHAAPDRPAAAEAAPPPAASPQEVAPPPPGAGRVPAAAATEPPAQAPPEPQAPLPPAPAPVEPPPAAPAEPVADLPRKPGAAKARLAQARALRERGETAKALEAFQKLVQEEPGHVAALIGRGLCYFELNQYGSAVTSFQQALALAPDDPDATMGLAETYRQTGKRAEAVALYQRYLAAHPDGEEADVARNALSQLKE